MVGRQLPFFGDRIFWLIWACAGRRGMMSVWPAILVAGFFVRPRAVLVSNFHGPWLVDILASVGSIGAVVLFLRVWSSDQWGHSGADALTAAGPAVKDRALAQSNPDMPLTRARP